jgi:hypothetical protein
MWRNVTWAYEVNDDKEVLMSIYQNGSRPDLKLTEATVQEIQLELIRRTNYNFFEGQRVAADLQRQPNLWRGVLLTRPGSSQVSGLITLRDLEDNIWNADTLYILATDEAAAQRLAELGETWQADDIVIHTMEATGLAVGDSRPPGPLVTMWWD